MATADASRTRLLRRVEATFAEIPAANAATQLMRFVRESLSVKNATVVSEEIRSDRQRSDLALVSQAAHGDTVQEVSYLGDFDPLIEAALCGTWTLTSVTDGVTTISTPTVTSATAGFVAGDVGAPISGAGIPALTYIGIRNSATSIGLSSSPTANTPVNATASGTGITLTMQRAGVLRNGTTNRSFGLEAGHLDLLTYQYFSGAVLNRMQLDVTAKQIVKMTSSWMCGKAGSSSTSVAGSTTPTPANGNSVMRAGSLIALASAGTANTELNGRSARRITLDINNNLRERDLATSYQTDDYGRGAMDITGTMETYFKDAVALAAFLANGPFALRFTMRDPGGWGGNAYQITLPLVKVTDAPAEISGVDSDIMQPLNFRALLDPAVGYAIDVQRGVVVA